MPPIAHLNRQAMPAMGALLLKDTAPATRACVERQVRLHRPDDRAADIHVA